MGAEDIEVDHQSGHLLRHGNGHAVMVLSLVAHQRDGALTYIYIVYAHA